MSALAQVRERVEAGQSVPVIAREMALPLDLAEQMVGHWQRLGVVTVMRADGGGGAGGGADGGRGGCADATRLHCAGCFFSAACPSRR